MAFVNKTTIKQIANGKAEERPVWLAKGVQKTIEAKLKAMTTSIFDSIRKKHMVEGRRIATIKDIEFATQEHMEEHVHELATKTLEEIQSNLNYNIKKQKERLDGYYGKEQTKIATSIK